MSAVPHATLTPPGCDLRGMPFLALDIVRLLDSDFYALSDGPAFKAGLTLWCRSFLQVPAASLPADERILAHLSGAGPDWPGLRDIALHGWIVCEDGRLYHPVVAEKARAAWETRQAYRTRAATRRTRGSAQPPVTSRGSAEAVQSNKGEGEGE